MHIHRPMVENRISALILRAAFKVHANLGPGLLASAYERCLMHELSELGLSVEKHKPMSLQYVKKDMALEYKIDLLVEGKIVVAVKSVEHFTVVHMAEVQTYLRLSGCHVGFLLNFNVPTMKRGVRRVLHNQRKEPLNAVS